MALISVNDLTFSYDGSYDNIFEHVSFNIDTAWRLGFTGRNGRGKTTFLKLLMGEYEYSGTISSPVSFDYFPFDVVDMTRPTIDILFDICEGGDTWKLSRELNNIGLDEAELHRPFETLSNGERTKALLAALFMKEHNFLLIDEPTNHLDIAARDMVRDYLKTKSGFILVSHDRAFLDGSVDHILSINRANIEIRRGNFSQWYENKERQDNFERDENERLKADIARLAVSARQTGQSADAFERMKKGQGDNGARPYMGEKSRKMQQRRKNLERRQENAIEEKSKLLKNIERNENLAIHPLPYRAERIFELRGLSINYGGRDILSDLSLTLRRGERVALTGTNGCGKSSIVKLIAGEKIPYRGTKLIGSGLVISYVPQDTRFLSGGLIDFARSNGVDETLFLTILRKLDFPRVQFEKDMRDFSAGQRKKVLIAKSLAEEANLYIWDEPLNYIDVLSRMQIESLIKEGKPTMLMVEHDRAFLENVATRIVDL